LPVRAASASSWRASPPWSQPRAAAPGSAPRDTAKTCKLREERKGSRVSHNGRQRRVTSDSGGSSARRHTLRLAGCARTVHAAVCAVCASALLHRLVDLDVLNHQRLHVQALCLGWHREGERRQSVSVSNQIRP
jgi:hypothetical protein